MDDKAHILEAYGAVVEQLFSVFFGAYTSAQSNAAEEAGAEQRFRNGIAHARYVRDRALSLL